MSDFFHNIVILACGFFWGAAFEMWRYRKERREILDEYARVAERVRIVNLMDAVLKPRARA